MVIAVASEVKNFEPGDRIMCGLLRNEGWMREVENYRHYCPKAGPWLGIAGWSFYGLLNSSRDSCDGM